MKTEEFNAYCKNLADGDLGLELFPDVNLGNQVVPFVLATDTIAFLIMPFDCDGKMLTVYGNLKTACDSLAKKEPDSSIYGMLAADKLDGIDPCFMEFCERNRILIARWNETKKVIAEKLKENVDDDKV